jgi:hypothetical protein
MPLLAAGRYAAQSAAGFATLLAVYNGLFCVSEQRLGASVANPLLAGGLVGAIIGGLAAPRPSVAYVASSAVGYSFLCVATHQLWRANSSPALMGTRRKECT